jgi:release factor glutamine methyltransferase
VTAADKFRELSQLFEIHGIDAPAKEAELLITETFSITKAQLFSSDRGIGLELSAFIDALAARRLTGEPMQYIIGHVQFHGLFIHVGKGVLIPRPETEFMVEQAIKLIKKEAGRQRPETGKQPDSAKHEPEITILDLCTGSGCIALALAEGLRQSMTTGVDFSEAALAYARRNAGHNGIANVTFLKGDLFSPLDAASVFDCIISNPPYIRHADIGELQVEIREHEPIEALDGGEDGLVVYRRIFREGPAYLRDNGRLILEIGADQADDIRQLASDAGFSDFSFIRDYGGIERIFIGKK